MGLRGPGFNSSLHPFCKNAFSTTSIPLQYVLKPNCITPIGPIFQYPRYSDSAPISALLQYGFRMNFSMGEGVLKSY